MGFFCRHIQSPVIGKAEDPLRDKSCETMLARDFFAGFFFACAFLDVAGLVVIFFLSVFLAAVFFTCAFFEAIFFGAAFVAAAIFAGFFFDAINYRGLRWCDIQSIIVMKLQCILVAKDFFDVEY